MTGNKGFTVVEVVIAIVIFSLGVLGLAGTAGSVTRMVGRSQQYGRAAALASERFEILRATTCGNMATGSSTSDRYSVSWTVSDIANGKQVTVIVTSPTARGARADTTTAVVGCVL